MVPIVSLLTKKKKMAHLLVAVTVHSRSGRFNDKAIQHWKVLLWSETRKALLEQCGITPE